jgi:CO/xanthine dehydrogenase Mo-binding subunit
VIALPPDEHGLVTVHGSLQCPYYVQKSLARCLGIAPERARVVQAATGGGFGGKEDYPSVLACHAALLARACGHPVRMIYERHEDLAVTPKRHPSIVRHRTAVERDGTLAAMEIEVLFDGGAYTTVVAGGALARLHPRGRCLSLRERAHPRACGRDQPRAVRRVPRLRRAADLLRDRAPDGPDRARARMHPLELRRRNMLRVGDTTATGQRLTSSVGSQAVLERADDCARLGAPATLIATDLSGVDLCDRVRRGRGYAFFFHGAGFTGAGEEMLKGRIAVELGARRRRARAQRVDRVRARHADDVSRDRGGRARLRAGRGRDRRRRHHAVPNSGPTVASRTCMIVGGVLAARVPRARAAHRRRGSVPSSERRASSRAAATRGSKRATPRRPD